MQQTALISHLHCKNTDLQSYSLSGGMHSVFSTKAVEECMRTLHIRMLCAELGGL